MQPQQHPASRPRAAALALVLCLACIQGGALATARAQDATPEAEAGGLGMDARPLFDGWYDPGRWVPLAVKMTNDGGDLNVELRASPNASDGVFSVPVELPRGSEKVVPLLVQPGEETRVYLSAVGGATPAAQSTFLKLTDGEPLVVVIGDESAQPPEVGAIGHSTRPIVVRADATELPENALGWGSVDFVVLAGADLGKASEAQRKALAQWVALGGELVVTGGPGMAAALGALPEPLRPAEVIGARDAGDFGTLAALAGGDAPDGSAPIAELAPAAGAVPIAPLADGAPLLVQRRYGDGAVIALAFDPALPPFSSWAGADELWAALNIQRGETLWSAPPAEIGGLGMGLMDLPQFELPSLRWLMALIAIYILLVGPVNYLVLRRGRRLDLAWVTIPALTLLFSALTYGAGYVIHGRELVVYELSAVRVIPEAGLAHVRSYVGLFSPGSQTYDVRIPGALVFKDARSGADGVAVQGPDSGVRGFPVEQWALGGFTAEAVIDWPSADPGQMNVSWRTAEGELVNPFGRDVAEAGIFTRGGAAPIGDWAAGGARKTEIPLSEDESVSLVFNPTADDEETRTLRAGILSLALGPSGDVHDAMLTQGPGGERVTVSARDAALVNTAIAYGWTEESPLAVDVAGRFPTRRVHTLIHADVPVIRPGEAQPVPVQTGVATLRSDASKRICGAGGAIFENQGTGPGSPIDAAEFRFEFGLGTDPGKPLWVELNGPPAEDTDGSPMINQVVVSLRACDSQEWHTVGGRSFAGDGQVPLPPGIQAAAGERKAVCLRLEPASFYQTTGYYYESLPQACWEPRLVTAPTGPNPGEAAGSYP